MATTALIILHPGFEELEATAPIDLLSRAGAEITQAALGSDLLVTGRSGIAVHASALLDNLTSDMLYDVVILPGGPGINKLRKNETICDILRKHINAGKLVACICAAPLLLLDSGIIQGLDYTAHPATIDELDSPKKQPVVIDGNVITSRGAGTATEFALAIVDAIFGPETRQEIATSICWPHC